MSKATRLITCRLTSVMPSQGAPAKRRTRPDAGEGRGNDQTNGSGAEDENRAAHACRCERPRARRFRSPEFLLRASLAREREGTTGCGVECSLVSAQRQNLRQAYPDRAAQ